MDGRMDYFDLLRILLHNKTLHKKLYNKIHNKSK